MIKMMFDEVKVGQKFVFDFDYNSGGDSYLWSYVKTDKNDVLCISCPITETKSEYEIEISGCTQESYCYIIED